MKSDMNDLVTATYKLLVLLYDNQVIANNEIYCPLSQDEMATLMNTTRATVNTHLIKLKELGFLETDVGKTKKYILTDRAIQIVEKIEKI